MDAIKISTRRRNEFVDITGLVNESVAKNGVEKGICCIYAPHTTCGLTINENADPSVQADIMSKLGSLVPESASYKHSEGNSDAHIKSALLGHSLQVIVENGTLALGTWQGIFLCEFDGPRTRQVWIKIIS